MIEAIQRHDLPAVIHVIEQAIHQSLAVSKDEADSLVAGCIDEILASLLTPTGYVGRLYRHQQHVVGVILLTPTHCLSSLFVDPDYHRQGVASALLQSALIERFQDAPDTVIRLNASTYAEGFYHRCGFQRDGNKKTYQEAAFHFLPQYKRY